ncbi:hypothetical protein BST61_g3259 [Cercospora zeina]
MPHRFPFASHINDDALREMSLDDANPPKRLRPSSLLRKPFALWRRHHAESNDDVLPHTAPTELAQTPDYFARRSSVPDNLPICRKAIPSLPRPQTFRRQESEKREKLLEVEPSARERRAMSEDRRQSNPLIRTLSPPSFKLPAPSGLDVVESNGDSFWPSFSTGPANPRASSSSRNLPILPPLQIPTNDGPPPFIEESRQIGSFEVDRSTLQEEFDRRWILNLSMHFRDKSNREKFFVTYAEQPTQWRRLTISLDYRNAPKDSLEEDLSSLHYQRDKSLRIYEAIRDSLPDIQYYDTVTNLKLETTPEDGQLHVHVREDANEIVDWPAISLFDHIRCPRFNESSLDLESHLSGFVYKVRLNGRVVIKKEIPGPDTVQEFIYEVNALDSLMDSKHVVRLEGLVTDARGECVKGLLISYASQGALVDMIYDFRGTTSLPWHRREKWAKQIVSGLADIHEAGFVQGDFTLSNIVIDEDDNAQIIDINRRGCPVGWEPPELNRLIDSGQRISMCIGVKTDLFQLGMVLWALAEEMDEPERVERPLPRIIDEVPRYFRDVVETCLSDKPQGRKDAVQLLRHFPAHAGQPLPQRISPDCELGSPFSDRSSSVTAYRSAKKYIDPDVAVTIDDVKERQYNEAVDFSSLLQNAVTYVRPDSNPDSMYAFDSDGSCIVGRRRRMHSRGRSPISSRRRRSSPFGRTASSATSYEGSPVRRRASGHVDECGHIDAEQQAKREDSGLQSHASNGVTNRGSNPPPLSSRRLAQLQNQDPARVAELLHTDSGFDEMMDELNLDASDVTEDTDIPEPPSTPRPGSHKELQSPETFDTPATTTHQANEEFHNHYTTRVGPGPAHDDHDCNNTIFMNDDSNVTRMPEAQHGNLGLRVDGA